MPPAQHQPMQPMQPPSQQLGGAIGQFGAATGAFSNSFVKDAAMKYADEKFGTVSKEVAGYVNVGQLRFYFGVDTNYVRRKLGLLLFPYMHKDWDRDAKDGKVRPPREDVNCPDLYIPRT